MLTNLNNRVRRRREPAKKLHNILRVEGQDGFVHEGGRQDLDRSTFTARRENAAHAQRKMHDQVSLAESRQQVGLQPS